jgi:hypothetical protein
VYTVCTTVQDKTTLGTASAARASRTPVPPVLPAVMTSATASRLATLATSSRARRRLPAALRTGCGSRRGRPEALTRRGPIHSQGSVPRLEHACAVGESTSKEE